MDFLYPPKVQQLQTQVRNFMDAYIVPRIQPRNREIHACQKLPITTIQSE